jgi:methionine aminopeptidase
VLDRYEREQGVSRDDTELDQAHQRKMQALWARAELATAAINSDFASVNAQALLAMNAALDAMVEEFAPGLREARIRSIIDAATRQADADNPDAVLAIPDEIRKGVVEHFVKQTLDSLPKFDRLVGSGAERYEAVLRRVGLGAPPDRPIPDDLDQALTEFGAIRDVLTHRHGRMDARALHQAPSIGGRYNDGDLVRLTREDYRTYSAAIRCYGNDVAMRPMRSWPEVSDSDLPDLARWRGYYMLGA